MKKHILQLIVSILFIVSLYSQETTPGEYTIFNIKANSKNNDFGSTFYGENKIIFSSSRGGGKKWDDGQPFLDLYEGVIEQDGNISKVKRLSSNINSKYHEASVSFSPDKKTVYFTRHNTYNDYLKIKDTLNTKRKRGNRYKAKKREKDTKKTNNVAMFMAKVTDGNWSDIVAMPFNNRFYSVGDPTVSIDGKKLYFSSDMPGTYGLTDIFVVDILGNGNFSKPKNLGKKINTVGSERFPYIDNKNILYFSSDSKENGLGGLDIYAVRVYPEALSQVLHLGSPMNSNKDDFNVVLNNNINRGYFSSNRDGGKGYDDIYHFVADIPLRIGCFQKVNGIVKNAKTNQILSNTKITVFNNGVKDESVMTDSNGNFSLIVPCSTEVKIIANKNEFEDNIYEFTSNNDFNHINNVELVLKPILPCTQEIMGIVRNVKNLKVLNNVTIEIINNIGTVVKTISTDENGQFNTNLPCDSSYSVNGNKLKYETATIDINTSNEINSKIKIELFLKPKIDKTEIKIVKNKVIVNIDPIYFDLNKANITPIAAIELNKVIAIMNKYPDLKVEGASHTDVRGSSSLNLALSFRRADATVNYIISNGIDANRINARAYGETQPINHCIEGVKCSNAEHGENRRTEFVILNPDVLGYTID